MRKEYCKIVRDRIPEMIENSGKRAEYEQVSCEEAVSGLEEKLMEETREYLESRELEEMADILEVMRGILFLRGTSMDEVEEIRIRKKAERGGFEKRIRLLGVIDDSEN